MPEARDIQVTIDCADPGALATFWAEVLGSQVQPPPPGYDSWPEALAAFGVPAKRHGDASAVVASAAGSPRLFFQRVPEPKAAKNRVHLDVRAAPGVEGEERMVALEAEAERLVALGATRQERHDPAPPLAGGHVVMLDPEGNEFCLD